MGWSTGERAQGWFVRLLCIAKSRRPGGRQECPLCSAHQQSQEAKDKQKEPGRAGPRTGSRREPELVVKWQGWARGWIMRLPVLPSPYLHELEARSGRKMKGPKTRPCGLLVPCPSGWMGAGFYLLFCAKPGRKRVEMQDQGGNCCQNFVCALQAGPVAPRRA